VGRPTKSRTGAGDRVRSVIPLGYQMDVSLAPRPAYSWDERVRLGLDRPRWGDPENRAPGPGVASVLLSLSDIEWTSPSLPIPLVFGMNE
jgi:hypothetical protein